MGAESLYESSTIDLHKLLQKLQKRSTGGESNNTVGLC